MDFVWWYVIVGLLLVAMALTGSMLKRLPLTASLFYVLVGFGLGPTGLGMILLDPMEHSALLERFTEVAAIVSLFSAGLKLRTPLHDRRWLLPLRLAFASMVLTVGLIALASTWGLGLPLGAAVLLGAILAPTDPVLASDVQVRDPFDRDRLRFGLTGEAGLNDGTAFPFVLLGLELLGVSEFPSWGLRWLVVDLLWGIVGGLAVGGLLGTLVARLVLYLRRHHQEAVGLDDFLALGLIALSYGVALLLHAFGFLAVFAAGLALRRVELQSSGTSPPEEVRAAARAEQAVTHPEKAPAYMAEAVLGFNEQAERIAEVAVMVLVGGMLSTVQLTAAMLWFIPLLLLLVRPAAVLVGLVGSNTSGFQRALMAWFGIRGIGSLYYLGYAIQHGVDQDLGRQLASLTLTVVAVSVVVHGISVTPLMDLYQARKARRAVVAGSVATGTGQESSTKSEKAR